MASLVRKAALTPLGSFGTSPGIRPVRLGEIRFRPLA
jgi:hypothetical protein